MEETTEQENSSNVVIMRLTTGEDIVAAVSGSDQSTIWVVNPLIIALQESKDGVGMRMVPFFMPFARGPITINTGNVVALVRDIDPQILDNYQRFFSPIIQPPSGIIAPE